MPDKKISELVNLTSLATDDEFVVVDKDANATKRTTYGNLSSVIRGDIVDGDLPAGSIVQVVNATTTTEVVNTTTSLVDTGLSATITPTSASNNILVLFSQNALVERNSSAQGLDLQLLRGASVILRLDASSLAAQYIEVASATRVVSVALASGSKLDSPATTSSVTYKIQGNPAVTSNNGAAIFQYDTNGQSTSSMTLLEVVA